jgi:hypothetical protein
MPCAGVPRICLYSADGSLGRERKKHVQVTNLGLFRRLRIVQHDRSAVFRDWSMPIDRPLTAQQIEHFPRFQPKQFTEDGRNLILVQLHIIGLVGFEPTASWSRTRRSTKLSHSPN